MAQKQPTLFNRRSRTRLLAIGLCLATSLSLLAVPFTQPASAQGMQPLHGYVVTVPAGTFVMGTVHNSLSSQTARAGDRVMVSINNPIMAGGSVAIPAGSRVEGQVVSVTSAGRAERNGQLDIRFSQAVLPTGQRIPISARIQTQDGTGILKGGTAQGRASNVAVKTGGGAALGAALGTAMGPLSGGSVGRGAIFGTALGAGLGALAAGVGKGEEVALNSGEAINIVLDAPITTNASGGGNYAAAPQQYGGQQAYQQPAYSQQPATYGTAPQNNGNFYTPSSTQNTYNSPSYGSSYQQQPQTYQQQQPQTQQYNANPYGY